MAASYRPPKYSKEQSKILFEEIAALINKNKKCPIWIGGNFNLPDTDWETRSVISHQYSKDINDKSLEVIDDCYLKHLVTFPTRASKILDVLNSTIHSEIQCHLQLPKPIQRKIYNWNKIDIGQLRADLVTHMDMFIQKKYCSNTNK